MLDRNGRVRGRAPVAALALACLVAAAGWSTGSPPAAALTVLRTDESASATSLPAVSIDDARVLEGDSGSRSLVFTLHLSTPWAEPVTVDVATFDSTATGADGDYVPMSVPVTFAPGSEAESLTVSVLGDTKLEPDEVFIVRLAQPVNTSFADSEAVGTIVNDDVPLLSIDDARVLEGDTGVQSLVFTVRLSAPLADPATVDVTTFDSTATVADADYVAVTRTLTFAPGSTEETVSVSVLGDTRPEPDEWLRVVLERPAGAALADSEAVGTIANDDLPSVSIDDARIVEGDTGAKDLLFTLRLSSPVTQPVSVDVSTFDSTATAADPDYVPVSRTVTFPPASVAESLAVSVLGDTKVEFDESFRVLLEHPAGAALADSEAVGTIENDDVALLTVADTSVAEGGAGTHPMAFRVRLTPSSNVPVTFHYGTFDGTATVANGDYEPVAGDTLFEAGQDQVVIEVPVHGDSLLEGNEPFTFRVSAVQGAVPSERSAIGTICNDEHASFERLTTSVPEYPYGTLPPAWGDLDGDGRPDMLLYENTGASFTEIPGARGLLGNGNYHGAAWCDFDRDGDVDVVQMPYDETESSYNFTHLFENTPDGLIEIAPTLGMDIAGRGETPSWGDFDADGWPDLFLPFYAHVPPYQCYLFLNLGNGQFRDFTDSAGVTLASQPPGLRVEGTAVVDWNGDGTLDLYCASHLFLNDGNAHFTDVRAQVGLPIVFDEGANFVDYDDDGDFDLYLRTSSGPTLFRNTDGHFTDVTASLGIGLLDWLYGDRWADLDSDGDLDLLYFLPDGTARLKLNAGDGTFSTDSSFTGLVKDQWLSSFADVDGDGDLDIALGAYGRQFVRNLTEAIPRAHTPYLKVRVEDDDGRLVEHGATVRLRSLDDPRHPVQSRIVDGGSGYLGQDEYTLTFGGVGSGAYDLEVSFPTKPGSPRIVGPAQNPLLGGIRPGDGPPKLVVVRPNGQVTIGGGDGPPAAAVSGLLGLAGALWPPIPNPARGITRFNFALPGEGAVTLTIHDLSGRRVRTLVSNRHAAGPANAAWDLRDEAGRPVPAGLYFARLARDGRAASVQRVVVLH